MEGKEIDYDSLSSYPTRRSSLLHSKEVSIRIDSEIERNAEDIFYYAVKNISESVYEEVSYLLEVKDYSREMFAQKTDITRFDNKIDGFLKKYRNLSIDMQIFNNCNNLVLGKNRDGKIYLFLRHEKYDRMDKEVFHQITTTLTDTLTAIEALILRGFYFFDYNLDTELEEEEGYTLPKYLNVQ